MTANNDDLEFQEDNAEFENDMTSNIAPAKKSGSRSLLAVLGVVLVAGAGGGYYYMTQMSGGVMPTQAAIPADVPQPDMAAMPAGDPAAMPVDPALATGAIDPNTGMPVDTAMAPVQTDPVTGMPVENAMPMPADPAMPVAGSAIDPTTSMPLDTAMAPVQTDPVTGMPVENAMPAPADPAMPIAGGVIDPAIGMPVENAMPMPADPAATPVVDQMTTEAAPVDNTMQVEQGFVAQPAAEVPAQHPATVTPKSETAAIHGLLVENEKLREQIGDMGNRLSSLEGDF